MEVLLLYARELGCAIGGGLCVWFILQHVAASVKAKVAVEHATLRERLQHREQELHSLRQMHEQSVAESNRLREENVLYKTKCTEGETRLAEERRAHEEKSHFAEAAQQKLSDLFRLLSSEALQKNNQMFLELARATLTQLHEHAQGDWERKQQTVQALVEPLADSLHKMEQQLHDLEQVRTVAYVSLSEQVKSLVTTNFKLQSETAKLVQALRTPVVRGRWGEIQLKRVVEIAGMLAYCDFVEQESVHTEEGYLRPDMLIKLPNRKNIVVDAKAPLQAYLDAMETQDEEIKSSKLKEHAHQVRNHLIRLSAKSYWDQFQPAPEFVVLFLPGESFFSAALEQDPSLIEYGVEEHVILATPTTLIGLLRAVAYGWRQERLTQNAYQISELGKTLYERVRTFAMYFGELRRSLEKTVESYNKSINSLETRVLVTARKFKELGASIGSDIDTPESITIAPRPLPTDDLPLFASLSHAEELAEQEQTSDNPSDSPDKPTKDGGGTSP